MTAPRIGIGDTVHITDEKTMTVVSVQADSVTLQRLLRYGARECIGIPLEFLAATEPDNFGVCSWRLTA